MPDNQFGVKLGDIRAMAKKIKIDHELAIKLWETGNVEAQLLATLIIKPKSLSADELDKLTRSTICVQVADWLNAHVVAQHPEKEVPREKWMMAKDRCLTPSGWRGRRGSHGSWPGCAGRRLPLRRRRAFTRGGDEMAG